MEQTNNKTLFILRHNDIIPRTSKIVNKTNEIANNAIEVGLILKEEDKLISRRTKLTNSYMIGANNTSIRGDNSDALASQIINNIMK